jgi:tetratricopeptide (TPR) repeat protein
MYAGRFWPLRACVAGLVGVLFGASPAGAWEWTASPEEGRAYQEALRAISEREWRESALIHYIEAVQKIHVCLPRQFRGEGADIPDGREMSREELAALRRRTQPIVEAVHRGVALDYARDAGWSAKSRRLRPYSHAFAYVAQIVENAGLYYERQKRYEDAMNEYLAALVMGCDLGVDPDFFETGIHIQRGAADAVVNLATSGKADAATLEWALDRLREVEARQRERSERFREAVRPLSARTRTLNEVLRAEVGGAQVTVALELWRREKGAYPERLEALAPRFLARVPADPFSGEPFRYRRAKDGARYALWSLGPDRDDDQARRSYNEKREDGSGDLILIRETESGR